MMKNRILILGITAALLFSAAAPIGAEPTIESVKQEKAETTSKLNQLQGSIDDLEVKKAEITGEIDSLEGQLVTTIAEIKSLEKEIANKEVEIEETGRELKAAEIQEKVEYEAMKKRIQYIYEKGGKAGWSEIFLSRGDISQLLNQAEYTQKMYKYDRECLDQYAATVKRISDLKEQQENERVELEGLKEDQEINQANLEDLLEQAKETSEDYDQQLAAANQKAVEYQKLIEEQTRKIDELVAAEQARRAAEEAARKAAEEARRRAAEEEAARRQAEEEAAAEQARQEEAQQEEAQQEETQQEEPSSDDDDDDYSEEEQSSSDGGNSGSESSYEEESEPEEEEPVSSGNSGTGQAVVNYAMQFIGNRYVWGGTSLTNGCDCSGFVMSVYAHFGYSLPHSSGSMRGIGRSVGGLSNAQPGDILCYSGHVGIYIGGGQMVNASNSAPYPKGGIKTQSATYRSILAIRRLV